MFLNYLRRFNLPAQILALNPGLLLVACLILGLILIIWSGVIHVGTIDAVVKFDLRPEPGASSNVSQRDLPLGYIQQLNYGPWFLIGMPLLLASAAMAWTWWNRSCDNPENRLPTNVSLRAISDSPILWVTGVALTAFFLWTNIEVEVRDYKSLGLGWVQAKAIHEAADTHRAVPGSEFRLFAVGGRLRVVTDAHIIKLDQPRTGAYKNWQFWAFVVSVKSIGGLWQATILYLSLVYVVAGYRLMMHMNVNRLGESEGSVQWTVTPATLMFFVGALTNVFSSSRYVANMAKGSYGSWDQYASFMVVSPGLATLILGTVSIYLVYFEARGKANPWAGTSKAYWWALSTAATAWLISSLGLIRLLIGLDPAAAQEITEWLQQTVGGK